jgi:hypothetical protein
MSERVNPELERKVRQFFGLSDDNDRPQAQWHHRILSTHALMSLLLACVLHFGMELVGGYVVLKEIWRSHVVGPSDVARAANEPRSVVQLPTADRELAVVRCEAPLTQRRLKASTVVLRVKPTPASEAAPVLFANFDPTGAESLPSRSKVRMSGVRTIRMDELGRTIFEGDMTVEIDRLTGGGQPATAIDLVQ